jgi:hypothetical protein
LGAKYLVVLCAGSTLPLAKQSLDEAPYKLSEAVAKLAGITSWSLAFSWTDKPWFLTEGKLYSSNLPLGVPNWTVIYTITHRHSTPLHACDRAAPGTIDERRSDSVEDNRSLHAIGGMIASVSLFF